MVKRFVSYIISFLPLLIPTFAHGAIDTLSALIGRLNAILNLVVPFIIGLAVFTIIWGIFTYVVQAANEEKRREAVQFIIWGVFGVFLMLSVWGLIALLTSIFDFRSSYNQNEIPKIPPFTTGGSSETPSWSGPQTPD